VGAVIDLATVEVPDDVEEPQDGIDSANRSTIDSCERIAREYADDTAPDPFGTAGIQRRGPASPGRGRARRRYCARSGSGPGWDADFVESQGVTVLRSEVTAAFIDFQTERASRSRSSMSAATNSAARTTR
jgi:hypothetical protein